MKRIFENKYALGLLCLAFSLSCKKTKVDIVTTSMTKAIITAPTKFTSIDIEPSSNAVVIFEWDQAVTANLTMAFYKVVFDKEGGDFSKPIYTATTEKTGSEPRLLISHKELNKIAYLAGVAELASAKLSWRVLASNGVVSTISNPATFEVKRPRGFLENPAEVFLSGSASEGGADPSKAQGFKKLSNGVFELYTSLGAGNFKLLDRTSGNAQTFTIDAGTLKDGGESKSPATSQTVYRINLDFNSSTATLTEIQSVGLWFSGYNKIHAILAYDRAGTWRAANIPIVWKNESWGKDERYKFRMTEKDAAGNLFVKNWGSATKDNTRPTPTSPASYFLLKEVDNTQYNYTFKFAGEAQQTDIEFSLSAASEYTHRVIFK